MIPLVKKLVFSFLFSACHQARRLSGNRTLFAIRNRSRWFAVSDQAEKNRLVKNVQLEKEGHHANRTTRFP